MSGLGGSSKVRELAKGSFPWGRPKKWAGGLLKRQSPAPPHKWGRCNTGGDGRLRCPAGRQWPQELTWGPEVRIGAKRLYEAFLLGEEDGLEKGHSWGLQILAGSP